MMDLFFNALKGQLNSLNLILLLLIVGFIFQRVQKKRLAKIFYAISFMFFVLTSTYYFPAYIVKKIESSYSPFKASHYPHSAEKVYVHALGGGYISDSRLEANAKLSWPTLGRLTEAIRIARLFDNSILVLSGTIASGNETLASVERRAAILCGNVEVGEGSLIGAGSVVLPGIKVGKWCTIAAGSVVTKSVPDGTLVIGSPASVRRQ